MRLWASCDTMTCDEVLLKGLSRLPLRFALSHEFINHHTAKHPEGLFLEPETRHLVPVEELGRHVYLMNGFLKQDQSDYLFESELSFNLYGFRSEHWFKELTERFPGELMTCLGRVSIYGSEFQPTSPAYEVIVHRFESLDLVHGSPTFGQWVAFDSYSKYIADPDVIGCGVLLADVEVLKRID